MSESQTNPYSSYALDGRWSYLHILCSALLRLALLAPVVLYAGPYQASSKSSWVSPARSGLQTRWTSVPVQKVEIFREWRLLHSDVDLKPTCYFCCRKIYKGQKCHVCSTCYIYLCKDCHRPIAAGIPSSQHLKPLRELRQNEKDISFVLGALKGIAYRDSRVLRKVLCQDDLLKCWVRSKARAYRCWQTKYGKSSINGFYTHFRRFNFVGWSAIHTMTCSLSLAFSTNRDARGDDKEDTSAVWSDLTSRWQDIYAFRHTNRASDPSLPCTHKRFAEVTLKQVRSMDGHALLDSSGRVSFKVFEALARKYEDAVVGGKLNIDQLQSTRLSAWFVEGFQESSGQLPSLMFPEHVSGHSAIGSDGGAKSLDSDSTSSKATSASDTLLDVSRVDAEDESHFDFCIEDVLDNLLEKMKSLAQDAPLRDETELVLETAWKMAQAIVYHDTPRPSLKEMAEQNTGFYTAPGTPETSSLSHDESNGSSHYGTPRSISPVSWIL